MNGRCGIWIPSSPATAWLKADRTHWLIMWGSFLKSLLLACGDTVWERSAALRSNSEMV